MKPKSIESTCSGCIKLTLAVYRELAGTTGVIVDRWGIWTEPEAGGMSHSRDTRSGVILLVGGLHFNLLLATEPLLRVEA